MNTYSFSVSSILIAMAVMSLSCSVALVGQPDQEHLHDTGLLEEREAMDVMAGKMVYTMSCIHCHGSKGRGDGAASIFIGPYSHPRPNDFTQGVFKFRSTESGQLPMLRDLMRTIREGIPGIMPSLRNMGEERIRQVALYVSREFIKAERGQVLNFDHHVKRGKE